MSTPRVNLNKEIIALFSGQAATFTTPRLYVELTSSQSLGLILNQIVFYSNKSKTCKNGWFYKPYKEWYDEILIPERTLRRKFLNLESQGLIETKVKKVHDLNTLHIRPNMDRIIELISLMLQENHPNRPLCPDGSNQEQKSCTKVDPVGHFDRSRTAILADSSIYTDDYIQITTTTKDENPSSSSFSLEQKTEFLKLKLKTDMRSDDLFIAHCQWHIDCQENDYQNYQRIKGLLKFLKGLFESGEHFKAIGYIDLKEKQIKAQEEEKLELFNKYQLYKRQFLNDRDFLKIAYAQGKEPLNFEGWKNANP